MAEWESMALADSR